MDLESIINANLPDEGKADSVVVTTPPGALHPFSTLILHLLLFGYLQLHGLLLPFCCDADADADAKMQRPIVMIETFIF